MGGGSYQRNLDFISVMSQVKRVDGVGGAQTGSPFRKGRSDIFMLMQPRGSRKCLPIIEANKTLMADPLPP